MKRLNKKGQVAVEFIFMFVIVISVLIYAFYFSFSLASLQYRHYVTFMVGRAVLSSSPSYKDKLSRAEGVQKLYDSSDPSAHPITSHFQCELSNGQGGFRGILNYGYPNPEFDVYSNAGIACSVNAGFILPNVLTGSSGNTVKLAIESMTGSEISDEHCQCLLDVGKKWGDCVNENPIPPEGVIDNGC